MTSEEKCVQPISIPNGVRIIQQVKGSSKVDYPAETHEKQFKLTM